MRRGAAVAALALIVAGCVPATRPTPGAARIAPPVSWRDAPVVADGAIDPRWWRAYGDPLLDQAVDQALARNTEVLSAVANVEAARAQARIARAELFPSVQAVGDAQAGQSAPTPPRKSAPVTDTFQVGGLAMWEVDLFGRVRALTRAARQRYVASQADRDAAALAVATATVTAYLQLLATDEQIRLIRATAVTRQRTLDIERDRVAHGYDSRLPLLQAKAELDQVEAQLPVQLLAQRRQENALAILTGATPGAVPRAVSLRQLTLPPVPAGIPATLLRRRPDIAAAEWRLAASDSTIAAQRAAFLPNITLSAQFLETFASAANYNPTQIWSVGNSLLAPLISLPLFRGGALRANLDRAVAERDLAAYAYRGAVLKALVDVENGLTGATRLGEQVDAIGRQVDTAGQLLTVARDRNDEGYANYLAVLDAQRALFGAQQALIAAEGNRLANLATLAAALGGGWSAAPRDGAPFTGLSLGRPGPTPSPTATKEPNP